FPEAGLPIGQDRIVLRAGGDGDFDLRVGLSAGQNHAAQDRELLALQTFHDVATAQVLLEGDAFLGFVNEAAADDGRFFDEDLRELIGVVVDRPVGATAGGGGHVLHLPRQAVRIAHVRIYRDGGDGDLVLLVSGEDARRRCGGVAVGDDDDVLLP